MKKKKNESGFTLVEVLIALSLVTLVVLSMAGLLGGLPRFYLQVREDEESGEIIETALSFMAREIRFATMFHNDSDQEKLIFRVKENSDDLELQYIYDQAGNCLQRRRLVINSGAEPSTEPMVDQVYEWKIVYFSPTGPGRFSQITLVLNGAQITVRPRLFRGEDAGGGWYE